MKNVCVIRTPGSEKVVNKIDWQLKTASQKPEVIFFTLRVNGQPIYASSTEAWYLTHNFAETWLFGEQSLPQFEQVLEIIAKLQVKPTVCDFTEFNSPARQAVKASGLEVVERSDLFR